MTQLKNVVTLPLKSSSSITLVKLLTDIAQSLIVTLLILLVNSKKFFPRMIEELVKLLKRNPNSSRVEMLL